ncbi:MAG: DNA alkylation repair protein [Bacteroidetes bacterium]|nr:DNA alkylation repair protein [Bacteroidota bacterium]
MLYSKASTAFDWIENANTAEILIIFAANSFMSIQKFIEKAQSSFEAHSTTERAPQMKAYMKDQFEFLGLSRPERNEIQKELLPLFPINDAKTLETIVRKLWKLKFREYHYLALDILAKKRKLIPELSFDFLNFLVENNQWWDSIDTICSKVIGPYYLFHKQQYKTDLKVWWESENFWKRRVCIIFQLTFKDKTDLDFLTKRILENSSSKEFFLQKAIGWALREYSKTNPKWVIRFVKENELKPLSRREALRLIGKE